MIYFTNDLKNFKKPVLCQYYVNINFINFNNENKKQSSIE